MFSEFVQLRIDGHPTRRQVRKVSGLAKRLLSMRRGATGDHTCGSWVVPCSRVVGLRRRLDVAFLGEDGTVLEVMVRVLPGQWVACPGASSALTLRSGMADHLGLKPGMALDLHA
jgi:hypothetical protein